jgi:hypothetical protein
VVVEREALPLGPYRMPGAGRDGVLLRRGEALVRLLHVEGEPAVVHAWGSRSGVRLHS